MVETSWMNKQTPSSPGRQLDDRRRFVDRGWDDHRYPPADEAMVSQEPPKTVERALKEDCHLDFKEYFLATVLRDGGVNYFTSSSEGLNQRDIPDIFKRQGFMRALNSDGPGANRDFVERTGFRENSGAAGRGRRSTSTQSFGSGISASNARRRPRTNANRRNVREETMATAVSRVPLRIGNSKGVYEFYEQRFYALQQNALKLIAKAWIKTLAPKKQSTHPYTGKLAPKWWPKPWGDSERERIRHREPDHLRKWERTHLCVRLLRLVVEPNENQHEDIRKLDLSVAKLEEVAQDALSLWFADHPNNEAKRPYFKELIKVAKMEEQYKRGEIGGNADVYIAPSDSIPGDEEEDEDEEGSASPRSVHANGSLSMTLQGQSPTATIPGPSSMTTLPALNQHYGPGTLTTAMGPEQPPYLENPTPMEIDDGLHSHHSSSRRTSMYTSSPSEYASGLGPQLPIYPSSTTAPAWQQTTSAPPSGSLFTNAYGHSQAALPLPPLHPQGHSQTHPAGYVTHMDVQLGQSQYLGSPFDGLPNPNALFRNTGTNPGHGAAPGYGQRGYGH